MINIIVYTISDLLSLFIPQRKVPVQHTTITKQELKLHINRIPEEVININTDIIKNGFKKKHGTCYN